MKKFLNAIISKLKNQRGYTLTELSISTSIIAVLAVGGLSVMQKKNIADRVKNTKSRIEKIELALESFIRTKRYVPCPADPSLQESNANFGKVSTYTGGVCAGSLTNGTGAVPVKDLNLPDEYAYDGWDRKFTFRTADASGSATDFDNPTFKGDIAIVNGKGTHKTNINRPEPYNEGAIYVIISHGTNGKDVAWRKNDTTTPPSQATGVEEVNTDHTRKVYAQSRTTDTFDDIVAYGLKRNIIPPKNIASPVQIDRLTCENAKGVVDNGRSALNAFAAHADGTTAQADLIFANAKQVSEFCDNDPTSKTSPANISNLTFWLDADDHSSLYTGNNCTTGPEPAADATIGCWKDKSGQDLHITEATNKPQYKTSIQNGKPILRFDGSNDRLSRTSVTGSSLATAEEITVFLAYQYDSPSHQSSIINWESASNRINIHGLWSNSIFYWDFAGPCCGGTNRTFYTPPNFVDTFNIVVADRQTDDTSTIWVNGAVGKSEGSKTDQFATGSSSTLYIGSTTGNYMDGDIGEIIIYNRGLKTTERNGLEFYLADKWGVTLSSSETNFCPSGMTFQKTATRPEGACQCASGTILADTLEVTNACHYEARETFNNCFTVSTAPTYSSPPTANDQKIWLDANDCTTITLTDGGKVTSWADKSANGRSTTQSTDSQRPLYTPNVLNKKPVIRFDGTNDAMVTNLVISSGSYTASVVFNYKSATSANRRALQGSNNWLIGPYTNTISSYGGTGWVANAYALNQDQFYIATATNNGTTANLYVDDITRTVTNTHVGYPGTINLAGAGAYPANVLNGDIAEVIIYDRVLGNTEEETINDYLSDKWAIITEPGNKTNLQLWLDAADHSTVLPTNDCAGNGAHDQQLVACWKDKSTNNRNAIQTDKSLRPHHRQFTQNHLSTIKFNGVDEYFSLSSELQEDSNITILSVAASHNTGVNSAIIVYQGPIGSQTGFYMYFVSGSSYKPAFLNKRDGGWGQDQAVSGTNPVAGQFYQITGQTSGTSTIVRVDGVQTTDVGSSGNINYGTTPVTRIGGHNAGSDVEIAEIILYNVALTSGEYKNIEYYLGDKWGITLP